MGELVKFPSFTEKSQGIQPPSNGDGNGEDGMFARLERLEGDIIGIKTKLKLHSLALGIILTSILGGLYYLNDRIDRKFEILDAKIGQMTILIDSKTDHLNTKFDHKLDSLADKIDQKFDLLINLIKTQK